MMTCVEVKPPNFVFKCQNIKGKMLKISKSNKTTTQSISKHGPGQVIQSSPEEVQAIHKESRHKSRPDTIELHTCVYTMYTAVFIQYIKMLPANWKPQTVNMCQWIYICKIFHILNKTLFNRPKCTEFIILSHNILKE